MPEDDPAELRASAASESGFTVANPKTHTLVQAQRIGELHVHQRKPLRAHSFAEDGPLRVGRIPTLTAARQEREADRLLADTLADHTSAVLCQVIAGMGGVGKTQIAAAYARRLWEAAELDLLVWVNASDQDSITSTFAEAGAAVCGVDLDDANRAARTFLDWLDRPGAPRWLVVLDDVTDLQHLDELSPPETTRGRTVVTTRLRHAAWETAHRTLVGVDTFTPDEAQAYFGQRLGAHSTRMAGAAELAAELGYLPLAMAQAAAYIRDEPGLTCVGYRDLLNDKAVGLAELRPEVIPDGYRRSVAAALQLSIEAAERAGPKGLAISLLQAMSLLDPAGIPADLFVSETLRRKLAYEESEPVAPIVIRHGLARLHWLSVIDAEDGTIRIHALVQRVVRDRLSTEERGVVAQVCADALFDVWPEIEGNTVANAVLRTNALKLIANTGPPLVEAELHAVLFRAGHSLGESGRAVEAAAYFRDLLARYGAALGPDHPDVLSARSGLARWRDEAGDSERAIADMEALVADYLRLYGPDDRDTLTARNNLASARGAAGDTDGAVAEYEVLLADRLRILGPDHLDTLTTRNNLAHWRASTGDFEALDEFEALLTDYLRVVGPDHPHTLSVRNMLLQWRTEAGELEGVEAGFEALIADCIRILGPDHPHTLRNRANLASARGDAGDAARALAESEALLPDLIRVHGPDHPNVLLDRNNIAYWRGESGDAERAVAELEALLLDELRVLGTDHPYVGITRNNIASFSQPTE